MKDASQIRESTGFGETIQVAENAVEDSATTYTSERMAAGKMLGEPGANPKTTARSRDNGTLAASAKAACTAGH